MVPVSYHRGVYLPSADLWLDPADPKPLAFVSHAHSDHIERHEAIIASIGTARLMDARMPGDRIKHLLEFRIPKEIGGSRITLYPAGHIFGSAQCLIEREEGSLLYTGDFKLRPGRSSEPAEAVPAETLIMETTYGLPRYTFPATEEVVAQAVKFCHEAIEEDAVPILLGYSLGKAQEILCSMAAAGLRVMLHRSVYQMTKIYEELGFPLPEYELYDANTLGGKVLICPPSATRSQLVLKIPRRRTAVLTGWAMLPGMAHRYQVDAAFPLSDHADYTDLIRYVELVRPKRVLTLHGYASQFAADLRSRGIEAWSLSSEDQLELTIAVPTLEPASRRSAPDPAPGPADSELHAFAEIAEAISATTGKLRKIEILSTYLRSLDDERLSLAVTYLTGRPFPQSDTRVLNLGWAVTHRALLQASGMPQPQLRELARSHADAGKTALEALQGRTSPASCSLPEAAEFFGKIHLARGPIAKTQILAERLGRLTALEGSYLIRIMSGDLRIGLKEGLVEEAIAAAFERDLDEVKEVNMLTGNLGKTALLARHGRLEEAELTPFQPIKCMLASPEPTAEAIHRRVVIEGGEQSVWMEDKFDGIRAQIHIAAGRAEIFTRDLKRVTETFDELAHAARQLKCDAIFDGEIIAREDGKTLTFFDLQKRLGRKTGDFFLGATIPVSYQIFDLLWLNGQSLLRQPLQERRKQLENLRLPAKFYRVEITSGSTPEEIENTFQAARRHGNEGLIVKIPNSLYTPGRRGMAWIKLKKELTTLDVAVVGAEWGHGKRNKVLSDYTFAVRDEATGVLLPIGKAYSGLTDAEIAQLTKKFLDSTTAVHGRYHEVEPNVVLEVAFDTIQPSTRHASGLALRFPRIKAIRTDKTPAQIDTLSFARSLVGNPFAPKKKAGN